MIVTKLNEQCKRKNTVKEPAVRERKMCLRKRERAEKEADDDGLMVLQPARRRQQHSKMTF
uniref:Uncharacterized protein n=1 Tax=Helianthus annuus TaxID=4232 RepID=A0A251ST43_HELAN